MEDRQFGRIRFLCGENGGKYPYNHSLYVQGNNLRVVIDPACSLPKLTRLKEEGVDQVWLSHWHEDHIHYVNEFEDCTVWISKRDFPPLTDLNIFMDWYGLLMPYQRAYWEKIMLEVFDFRPRQSACFIEDNQIIDLGGLSIQVIATPGHTPGHLSFFFPEEGLLFLGDYDLTSFGPWYGDVASSIEDTIRSIHRLKNIPASRWVVAHNTGLYEENPGPLWDQYESVIYERESKLLAALEKPKTLEAICACWIIYGKPRQPKEFFEFNEKVMIGKHLEYALSEGRIVCENGLYRRA
ncbi:MAG: MBL fold metallo-hydrolase [Smithellaceae bacterium]|nr:MBL fold metallo-hydrolase [Smithellaceae bacterium]